MTLQAARTSRRETLAPKPSRPTRIAKLRAKWRKASRWAGTLRKTGTSRANVSRLRKTAALHKPETSALTVLPAGPDVSRPASESPQRWRCLLLLVAFNGPPCRKYKVQNPFLYRSDDFDFDFHPIINAVDSLRSLEIPRNTMFGLLQFHFLAAAQFYFLGGCFLGRVARFCRY